MLFDASVLQVPVRVRAAKTNFPGELVHNAYLF